MEGTLARTVTSRPASRQIQSTNQMQPTVTAHAVLRSYPTSHLRETLQRWFPNNASAPHGGRLKRSARAVCAQCARSATIWASSRTRDPYFEILGAPRGIMVTPSGGFDF